MPGYSTNGLPNVSVMTGLEQFAADTEATSGLIPQSVSITLSQLANELNYLNNRTDGSTVSGSRYIVDIDFQSTGTLTGLSILVGTVGGTDSWILELHDSTGLLVARTLAAGTTAGTANTWQQIAFITPYVLTTANVGQYYIALQSNGTTAKYAAYNAPTSPHQTGTATGVFGTAASITVPTTYTAGQGPLVMGY